MRAKPPYLDSAHTLSQCHRCQRLLTRRAHDAIVLPRHTADSMSVEADRMVRLKAFWRGFSNFAVIFSFIMNFVFLMVLIVLVIFIFDLKRGLVQPLINGLHSSFVGLDEATIITTINVKDTVPVKLSIPFSTNTVVALTDNVPVRANATFNLPGGGGTINGSVNIVLPTGLKLPVSLSLTVPVDDKLPINLSVPVNIKLKDTQLHDAFDQLRGLLVPYVRLLGNLPNSWPEVWSFIGSVLGGNQPSLFRPNQQSENPWPGFRTGLGTPTIIAATPVAATATPFNTTNATNPPGGASGQVTPLAPVGTPTRVNDLGIITPAAP